MIKKKNKEWLIVSAGCTFQDGREFRLSGKFLISLFFLSASKSSLGEGHWKNVRICFLLHYMLLIDVVPLLSPAYGPRYIFATVQVNPDRLHSTGGITRRKRTFPSHPVRVFFFTKRNLGKKYGSPWRIVANRLSSVCRIPNSFFGGQHDRRSSACMDWRRAERTRTLFLSFSLFLFRSRSPLYQSLARNSGGGGVVVVHVCRHGEARTRARASLLKKKIKRSLLNASIWTKSQLCSVVFCSRRRLDGRRTAAPSDRPLSLRVRFLRYRILCAFDSANSLSSTRNFYVNFKEE